MRKLCVAAFASVIGLSALADETSPGAKTVKAPTEEQTDATDIDPQLVAAIHRDPNRLLSEFLSRLFQLDPNGSVSLDALRTRAQNQYLRRKANTELRYRRYDLDGDGNITDDEVQTQLEYIQPSEKAELLSLFYLSDADGDGVISDSEIRTLVNEQVGAFVFNEKVHNRIFQFDMNNDRTVTRQEIIDTFEAALKLPDPAIAEAERRAEERRLHEEKARAKKRKEEQKAAEVCTYPEKSKDATLVLVGTDAGAALSNVAVTGLIEATTVAQLYISEGDRPLYIVAGATQPTIWEVTGAIDRVEQIVTHPTNAVSGLEEGRVAFAEATKCVPTRFNQLATSKYDPLMRSLMDGFDNARVLRRNARQIGKMSLPRGHEMLDLEALSAPKFLRREAGKQMVEENGKLRAATNADRAILLYDNRLRKFHPAGVRRIDPSTVVHAKKRSSSAIIYTELPAEAGMMELLERGDLIWRGGRDFEITRHFRGLPAGLLPSDIGKLYLSPDIQLEHPPANMVFFSIYDTETGECRWGSRCSEGDDR